MGNLKVKKVEVKTNKKKKLEKSLSYVMVWLMLAEKIQNF